MSFWFHSRSSKKQNHSFPKVPGFNRTLEGTGIGAYNSASIKPCLSDTAKMIKQKARLAMMVAFWWMQKMSPKPKHKQFLITLEWQCRWTKSEDDVTFSSGICVKWNFGYTVLPMDFHNFEKFVVALRTQRGAKEESIPLLLLSK